MNISSVIFSWMINKVDCSPLFAVIDGMGIYGHFLHYGIVIALVGSAFLVFLYLWRNKRLDADEEPKFQMMQEEEIRESKDVKRRTK